MLVIEGKVRTTTQRPTMKTYRGLSFSPALGGLWGYRGRNGVLSESGDHDLSWLIPLESESDFPSAWVSM